MKKYYWFNIKYQWLCKLPCNDKELTPFQNDPEWVYICHEKDYTEEFETTAILEVL
jgi:hypothetical protein